MKFFITITVTTSLFYLYSMIPTLHTTMFRLVNNASVRGQQFENPNVFYKKMTFDSTLRGSFNLSECVKEMMNCFELVKPEVICERNVSHDTVCGVMRGYCHDYYGNYDSYNVKLHWSYRHEKYYLDGEDPRKELKLQEQFCYDEQYSK